VAQDQANITGLLNEAGAGNPVAGQQLMQVIAGELHRLAAHYMRGERAGHVLQPTALVNEAYMKLFHGGEALSVNNRSHFFALAATQMRRILVDYARGENANKRKGIHVEFDEIFHGTGDRDRDLIMLDDALKDFEKVDPEASKVVELRFFGGYTHEETATILETNVAKVRRDWEFARAWLYDRTSKT
jgi:RNA polymerase sigma factor (TIGR02999 family)